MKKTILRKLILTASIFTVALLTGCAESDSNEKRSLSARGTDRIVNSTGANNIQSGSSQCNLNSQESYQWHLTPGQASTSQFGFNDFIGGFNVNEEISFSNSFSGMELHHCQATNTLEFVFVDDFAVSTGSYANVLKPSSGFRFLGSNYKNFGQNVTAYGDEFGTLLIVRESELGFGRIFYEEKDLVQGIDLPSYFIGNYQSRF